MRVAVIGAGAMGSVYAALLASAGHDVSIIDTWPDHIEAIRTHGLRVTGASGERTVEVGATSHADEVGEVDLVVIATKAMDVAAAAASARPLLGSATDVLAIQNGLGGSDAAAGLLGEERVLVGVAGGFGASIITPGHAHHEGMKLVTLGERSGPVSPRVELLADVWRTAGFAVETSDDMRRVVWEKLICNVAYSGPCAILDATIGEVLADEDAWALAAACAVEADEVARAVGVAPTFDDPSAHVRSFGGSISEAYPSLVSDLRAGRRTEIAFINGAVPRAGRAVGVAAPVNRTVTWIVQALESRGAGAADHQL